MKSLALLALAAASTLPSALAHGFVDKIIVKGSDGSKTYAGPEPWGSETSIIRRIDSTDPNHINDGDNLACGKGAATRGAKLMGNANPGDTLSFNWNAGDGTPWPHDSGPLITYMAKCDGDCSSFDATQGKYFKIDEIGKTKTPGNTWYQATILMAGQMYDVKLPEDLPSGDYIVRHEIIALHLADSLDGAEFYPSCSQFTIGGSNSGSPNGTVSFPGAYKDTDPGIHINIWDKTGAYPYPGPGIVSFSASSSSGSSTSSNSTSSSSSNNSSVSSSSSDNNSNDNSSSSDDGSNDANAASGNDSNNSDDGCDDQGGDNNDNNSAASGTTDNTNNSGDNNDNNGDNGNNGDDNGNNGDDASTNANKIDPNVVYQTVTVTKTVTVSASATPKVRLARETSTAPRRSRMHHPKKHSS